MSLFATERLPGFARAYRVYDWDWQKNKPGPILTRWPVTLLGLAVDDGEPIHLPRTGREVYPGYEAVVLYASEDRITVKYTREDNVVHGYTIHLEDVCVDPELLALYRQANAAGRGQLPGLRAHQALGRAEGEELGVAIRDAGTFMDPRSRKDWWRGY